MKFEGISMETFYRWGFFLLATNALVSFITLVANISNWVYMYWWGVIGNFASTGFSFLLAGFFYYLKRSTEPSISDEEFLTKFAKEEN